MKTVKSLATLRVLSPHRYQGAARDLTLAIKNATNDKALDRAAVEMSRLCPVDAVLTPAPSSSGLNNAMRELARRISELVDGAELQILVERVTATPSAYLLRKAGRKPVPLSRQIASMAITKQGQRLIDYRSERPIVLVDNVITSGTTALAVWNHLGDLPFTLLTYSDARKVAPPARSNPSKLLRVVFSGSREFRARKKIRILLDSLVPLRKDIVVVHGGAEGVDSIVGNYANELGFETDIVLPNWNKYGASAGPKRNREMMKTADYAYAFWDGSSRGTASAIKAAGDLKVPLEVILD